MKLIHLIIYILLVTILAGCDDGEIVPDSVLPPSRRTVMAYLAVENSLGDNFNYAMADIDEMVRGCADIPDDCRMLVYIDDYYHTPCIYEISKELRDTVRLYTYSRDFCSAEPQTMAEALLRMRKLAPAHSYGLILGSHGSGWTPGSYASHTRSIFQDVNRGKIGSCAMNVEDMVRVLSLGPRLDFLFMDMCMMQSIEVDYALRHVVDYIIASPAEIPGLGGSYDHLMPHFFASPFSATAIAHQYYIDEQNYQETNGKRGVVISVVDARELDNMACATRNLLCGETLDVNDAQRYMYCSLDAGVTFYPDGLDLLGVMQRFADKPEYQEWLSQLYRTVPYHAATTYWDSSYSTMLRQWSNRYYAGKIVDQEKVCGVSIFVPQDKYDSYGKSWNRDIQSTEWWQAVKGN